MSLSLFQLSGRSLPLCLLALSLAWFSDSCCAQTGGFPAITSYSTDDIGANARGWVTVQDREGVLHFGCDALVSFDGERWRTTAINGGYALRGLDFGSDGRLWAAAAGEIGWFERIQGEGWIYRSLRYALPDRHFALGEVWHVFAEGAGALFVSAENILRWDGTSFQIWPMPGTRRLWATRLNGLVYVHHRLTGLYVIEPHGPRKVVPAETLGDAGIFWLEPQSDGWLYAGTKGLFRLLHGQSVVMAPEVSKFAQDHFFTCAVRLADRRLAIGTFEGGIALMQPDGQIDRVFRTDNGLPTRAIHSLFLDREGGLWGTSPTHIFRLAVNSQSALFDVRSGLPSQPCLKIVRHEDRMLAATGSGVFALDRNQPNFHPHEVLRETLWDMRVTRDGLLVARNNALQTLSGARLTELHSTRHDVFVSVPSRHLSNRILAADGRNIVVVKSGQPPRTLVKDLPDSAVSIAEDNRGRLWIGTTGQGVLVASINPAAPAEAMPAGGKHDLPDLVGTGRTAVASDGTILVFSTTGAWCLRPDAENFVPIAGYPRRDVAGISDFDANNHAWIVHPAFKQQPPCVARLAVNQRQVAWEPHSVESLGTIGTPRSIYAETTSVGGRTLWIGGTRGLLRHSITDAPNAPAPQPPIVRAFATGADRDTREAITGRLPYATRSVLFEFAAPEFARRRALRIESFVEGIDREWVPVGPDSRRELTAMRDGTYTLRARTVAETGVASRLVSFPFAVAPPWWRTVPAIGSALLALAAGTMAVFRLRVRALKLQNAALEEKVRQRTEQLMIANAAKTQFLANMSHDIRNPLNGIVGLALALEQTKLDAKQDSLVGTLRECTTHLSTLVEDVLDFARIEAGRIELRPGPFAPAELLRSTLTMLGPEAQQRGAVLTSELGAIVPEVLIGDAGRIQQILVNYVSNALKYAGGHIRISLEVADDAGEEIEFTVADNGPGLSAAEQALLFTKFTRLPGAQRDGVQGTGLGLASCRLLADAMGGSVGVKSDSETGKRFFLRLPLEQGRSESAESRPAIPNVKVLLVEDTDYNATAATAVLEKLGLTCERARNGSEALQRFSESAFQVVLLDRNLPDMDGTEVARRMRELEAERTPALILAVTAYCTAQDRDLCLAAGMDVFVGKPLTPEKLRQVFSAAAGRLLSAASVQTGAETIPGTVDLSLLNYLSDGTQENLTAQIGRFLDALAEAESQMQDAARSGDFPALATAAHSLLAQARMVGHRGLAEASQLLESAARDGNTAAIERLETKLLHEVAQLRAALSCRAPTRQSG